MGMVELLQRAIHSAKCRMYRINYDLNCDISLNHQKKAENQKELMDITVDALEKQIPKKLDGKDEDDLVCGCHRCGEVNALWKMNGNRNNYCGNCGQAIDWSDKK